MTDRTHPSGAAHFVSRGWAGGGSFATGETGTRCSPARYLAPREPSFSLPGARIVVDKPDVTHWREDRDAAAAQRLAELLDRSGRTLRVGTDALATVGGNLYAGSDSSGPLVLLDLNNGELLAETDTLRRRSSLSSGWCLSSFSRLAAFPFGLYDVGGLVCESSGLDGNDPPGGGHAGNACFSQR